MAGHGRNSPNVHEEYKTSAPTADQQKTYNSTTHQRHGNDGTTARVFDSNIPVELSAVIATLHVGKQDQGTRGQHTLLLPPGRRQNLYYFLHQLIPRRKNDMAAGPKARITAEPLSFKGYPRDRANRRIRFIHNYLRVPRGHGAGKPVKLRDFQKEIITGAFAPGILTALLSMPRGQGKTSLAAMLGLAELFVGPPSAECLVVASDQRQANITFNLAKRMVELNPELSERVQVYKDRLFVPHNDANLIPLPADYSALQGFDPSLLIVDELHVVTEDVWSAAVTAAGKRPESLTLAISTPAASEESVMYRLVKHGREGDDDQFYLKEYAAPDGCETSDREAWRIANPALACKDPFLSE